METTVKSELAIVVDGAFAPFNDAGDLATFLGDMGITGRLGSMCMCPIAVLLSSMMDDRVIQVDHKYAEMEDETHHLVTVPLPEVARSFVRRFDSEEWWYLVDTNPVTD